MKIEMGFKPKTREEAEDALLYWELMKKGLEAYLLHTDPNNITLFGEVFDRILDARDEIERLSGTVSRLRANNYGEA